MNYNREMMLKDDEVIEKEERKNDFMEGEGWLIYSL